MKEESETLPLPRLLPQPVKQAYFALVIDDTDVLASSWTLKLQIIGASQKMIPRERSGQNGSRN